MTVGPETFQRISYIRKILASGMKSTTVDGVQTTYDLNSMRQELARLEQEAGISRRPRFYNVSLSNAGT